jgi:hypothetical protein
MEIQGQISATESTLGMYDELRKFLYSIALLHSP